MNEYNNDLQYQHFSNKAWNNINKYLTINNIEVIDIEEFRFLVNRDINEQYIKCLNLFDSNIVMRRAIKYLGKEIRIKNNANTR